MEEKEKRVVAGIPIFSRVQLPVFSIEKEVHCKRQLLCYKISSTFFEKHWQYTILKEDTKILGDTNIKMASRKSIKLFA